MNGSLKIEDNYTLYIAILYLLVILFIYRVLTICKGLCPRQFISPTTNKRNVTVKKINYEGISEKCAICLETFNHGETLFRLECLHYFHEPCVTEWLIINDTCPLCRKDVVSII
jgi:hypothetical protein